MIPNDQLQLLTAAVDGELTPAEVRQFRRLLRNSAEARTTFNRLQADRDRLRALPTVVPPADLHGRIMARLPQAVPVPASVANSPPVTVSEPAPRPLPIRPTRSRPWVPLAVAASLLLAVSGGSFWFFMSQDRPTRGHSPSPQIASNDQPRTANRPTTSEPSWADVLPPEDGRLPSVPEPPHTAVADASRPPLSPERLDVLPRPVVRDVFGANVFPAIPPLDLVQVRVPFLAPMGNFDREDVRQQFTAELARDPAFRIDVFVKDTARGMDLFQAAGKESGITVLVDAGAHERAKRKQATAYAAYTECLTPSELRDLFARLAAGDARHPQPVFDMVHVAPASQIDQKDIKELIGTDPGLWKRPTPHSSSAAPPAEPKPISAGTGDQVAKSLASSPAKAKEKTAIVLTYSPAHSRTAPVASRELKQFLEKRSDRKPSAVPVLVVIRPTNAG